MTLLDEMVPKYDRELSQSVFVARPPHDVFQAIHEVKTSEMPLAVFLSRVRTFFGGPDGETHDDVSFSEANERVGWVSLGEIPDREMVMGLIGQFWKRDVGIDRVDKDGFLREPPADRVKIGVDYALDPVEGGTRLTMHTRVQSPADPAAKRKFEWYFRFVRLGMPLVVGSGLRAIKRRAERTPVN